VIVEKKLAFEPHKINRENFHPIGEHIIVTDMKFEERITRGGIILPNDDMKSQGIRPRWCRIYAIGPEYDGMLKEGQYILVSHGRWTRGINIQDETGERAIRRVDPNDILLVSDSAMDDESFTDKVVL
jgi:co-chaperonin GroES (HSP10)